MTKIYTITVNPDSFVIQSGYDKTEVLFKNDEAVINAYNGGALIETFIEHPDDAISAALSEAGVYDYDLE